MLLTVSTTLAWFILSLRSASHVHRAHHHDPQASPEKDGRPPPIDPEASTRSFLIDLDNARCPSCGAPADDHTVSDWRGVRVHLSEPECGDVFRSDPVGRLDANGVPWRDAVRDAERVANADERDAQRLLAELRGRRHVVSDETAGWHR